MMKNYKPNIIVIPDADLFKSFIGRKHYLLKYLLKDYNIYLFNTRLYWKETKEEYRNNKYQEENINFIKGVYIIEGYPYNINDAYLSEICNIIPNIKILKETILKYKINLILNFSHFTLGILSPLWNKNIPIVYDFLDYRPEQIGHKSQSIMQFKYLKNIVSFIQTINIKHSNSVVSCSKLLYIYSMKLNKNGKYISNGIDLDAAKPKNVNALKKNIGYKDDDFIIGYVGGIHWLIDFNLLIKIFKKINNDNIKLLMIGDGSHYEKYKYMTKKHNLDKKIKFIGRVAKKRVTDYINLMNVGIIPFKTNNVSKYSFPLKALEYLACGIPIISCNIPAMINISNDLKKFNIFKIYNNQKQLIDIIKIFYKNHNHHNNIQNIEKIREYLLRYDWQNITNEYSLFLKGVIKQT